MLPDVENSLESHKTGHHLADLTLALTAVFISLCSLGLAIHHGHTMQQLVEANSRPFVQFNTTNAEPNSGEPPVKALKQPGFRCGED